jgi:O-antigen ligase
LIQLYKWNLFAINYLPGWSNTLPLYLVFALFINRKLKYPFYYSALLLFAIFLTDSRGSILGAIGVFVLPIARKFKKIIIIFLISILTIILIYVNVLIDLGGDIKFLRSFDRVDIFLTSISYIKQSWLFGYGGNTIEQLSYVKISHDPLQDWGHTHNFVLEFALRYGLIGLVLFILFLFFKIREIKDFDFRYLFILFIALAFFQTFMRDFTFLSILIILSHFRYFSNRELNIEESK